MNPTLIPTLTLEPTEALVLIGCDEHFSDEYGFVWPSSGTVQAQPLYGLLWGESLFFSSFHTCSQWIIARVVNDLCQNLDDCKVEFPTCEVVYVGDYPSAREMILAHNPNAKPIGNTYRSSQDQTAQIHQGNFNHLISSGRLCSGVAVGKHVRTEAEGSGSTSIAHGPHPRATSKGTFSQGIAVGFAGASSAEGIDSLSLSSGDGGTSRAVGKDCISVALGKYDSSYASGPQCSSYACVEQAGSTSVGRESSSVVVRERGVSQATGGSAVGVAIGDSSSSRSDQDQSKAIAVGKNSQAQAHGPETLALIIGDFGSSQALGDRTKAIVLGSQGRAQAGQGGLLALIWHDGTRERLVVGYVGENGIEADQSYRLDQNGKLIPEPLETA